MDNLTRKINKYIQFSESLNKKPEESDTTVKDTAKDSLGAEGIKLPSDNVEIKSPDDTPLDKGLETCVLAESDTTAKKV